MLVGPLFTSHSITNAAGDHLFIWSNANLAILDATGAEQDQVEDMALLDMRATTAGAGLYVLGLAAGTYYVEHFDDLGTRDTAFGQIALPAGNAYYAIQIAPGGRILAVGPNGVAAISAGALDTSWGTNGVAAITTMATFPFTAIDSLGRLYIAYSEHVTRLTTSGAIDSGFAFGGTEISAVAIDQNDHVLIGTAQTGTNGFADVLDTSGGVIGTWDTGQPGFVTDLAVDVNGGLYATASYVATRFGGFSSGPVGFVGATGVRCGRTGPCWVTGVTILVDPNGTGGPNENWVARLAN